MLPLHREELDGLAANMYQWFRQSVVLEELTAKAQYRIDHGP
jgi:hypothetical protein